MSKRAIPLGFVGLHFGVFGLILLSSPTEVARLGSDSFLFASLAWVVGLVFLLVAVWESNRPD